MADLPAWTDCVSDRVMNAQVIAQELVDADGVRTPREQQLLDELYGTQEYITEVDDEIDFTLRAIRKGRVAVSQRARLMAHNGEDQDVA